MTQYIERHGISIAPALLALVEQEIAPGTEIDPDQVWKGYAALLADLVPLNRALLAERSDLQTCIDNWHLQHPGQIYDPAAYRNFLQEIGYIVPEGEIFEIDTTNVDPEIATMAGPQLVVPVSNARFALNAANARWGSLYDALYGTDVIAKAGSLAPGKSYNAERGAAVVARAAAFLDQALPLETGSHADVTFYRLRTGTGNTTLEIGISDGTTNLTDPAQFVGHSGSGDRLCLLFVNNGLHIEIHIDPTTPVGAASTAGVSDVVVEAALTTIQDCEDSVAAVDVEDKVAVYRNWLGLMKGDLTDRFEKNGETITRSLAPDRTYTDVADQPLTLPGRSLLLVRNVGHLMTTDAVLGADGAETPEGLLDALITAFCAVHDLRRTQGLRNSRAGSVYIVKPKMHGPREVEFTDMLFNRVEDILGLTRHTLKVGVMDEERRTSVNLRECIRAVRHRLVFINTGFLDRTGDEIHTSMLAGPVLPKGKIKDAVWLGAYEDNNVDQGLDAGLMGRAQIGKGMWARPDDMADMLEAKIGHPKAGANTAWVPSPTAAVLHATHYHLVNVPSVQESLKARPAASLDAILTPPLLVDWNLSAESVARELDNNAQSILGYVVRWIDHGIGCSKVPDLTNVALMEDRATLRISAQQIANWLKHGLLDVDAVKAAFVRMALVVDYQNSSDPKYRAMAPNYDASIAFQAALELVLDGARQPNGYTEPVLHRRRRAAKAVL